MKNLIEIINEFVINQKLKNSKQLNMYHVLRSNRYYVEVPDKDTYIKLVKQITDNEEQISGTILDLFNDNNNREDRVVLIRPAVSRNNNIIIGSLTPMQSLINDIYRVEKMESISISQVTPEYWQKQGW